MKKIFVSIFSFMLAASCFAQTITRAVKIEAKNSGDRNALSVYEISRKTEIVGNYSSTTIEYMIENRTNRVLEGEFEFPLEDGESVAGYALDINGVMRQGVAVEKEKGRQVFEDVVRRNVDPGLVEMTAGNNFKTRVYPISANGVRHIQVTVEKEVKGSSTPQKVYIQTQGRDTYFYFYQDAEVSRSGTVRPDTRNVTVLFDVSDSAKNRDIEKELDFLKKYSAGLGNPKIKFVAFANSVVDSFEIDFGRNARDAESKIRALDFDGATNLDVVAKYFGNEVLLFSDGIDNWGSLSNYSSGRHYGRVSTVVSSRAASFGTMKKIAGLNDGIYINLNEMDTGTAATKIFENPLRVVDVEFDRGMEEVYPAVGTIVDGGVSVAGILKNKNGRVKISLGRGGRVEQTVEMDVSCVPSQNVVESEKVSRLWAMQKIADLDMDYDANRDEIMRLAKKYTIVTKDTSLIVLDSVQDYVRYGIEPPEDLKDEYDRIVSRQTTSKPVNDGIPQEVYTKFEEFKRWWNKKPEDFKKANSKEKGAGGIGRPRTSSNELRVAGSGFSESVPNASVRTSTASSRASEAIADFEWEEDEAEYEPMMADAAPMDYVGERYLGEAKGTSEAKGGSSSTSTTVTLQTWSSKSDYISILKKTPKKQMYEKYLELKKSYGASPAFFMEVSDYFVEENLLDDGLRILSNLAEMNLENTDVLRALGNKLVEHGQYAVAIRVFRNLTKLREGIPQFYRDLAMAYEKNGEYQNAVDALWHIASNKWDSRYSEIQQTALNDMNSIIARCAKKSNVRLDTSAIDRKLMENFDVDLRVVLTWNTDDCDIDLWVTDPNGEKCFYGHKETAVGGRMSRDFTQGYGPEEFCLKVAPGGKYKIECNYYGSHQQKLLQPVIVQAEVYTNFGRPNQEKQVMTLQLDDVKQTFLIGDVNVR